MKPGLVQIKGEIDVKQFYLPGLLLKAACPACSADVVWDGDQQYISNPVLGKAETLHMYCVECDHALQRQIKLRLTVEVLP